MNKIYARVIWRHNHPKQTDAAVTRRPVGAYVRGLEFA